MAWGFQSHSKTFWEEQNPREPSLEELTDSAVGAPKQPLSYPKVLTSNEVKEEKPWG